MQDGGGAGQVEQEQEQEQEQGQVEQGLRGHLGCVRTNNVDLRFFLKPAPLPPGSEDVEMIALMRDILTSLPGADNKEIHQCIQYFTR